MQDDFGGKDGIVLIGHRDEAAVRASYARHLPMSTSILAFHKLDRDETGEPALILERHGSLGVDDMRELAAQARLRPRPRREGPRAPAAAGRRRGRRRSRLGLAA